MEQEVSFIYNGITTSIQCKKEDKMKDIFKKYTNKTGLNTNDIIFYIRGKI